MKNMAYKKNLSAATARGALVLALVCTLSSLALGRTHAASSTERPPLVATSLRAITSGDATLIEIAGTAPMPFSVSRPDERRLVVELPGVDSTQLSPAYAVTSPLVEQVTVNHVLKEGEAVTSLQVSLRAPARERSHLNVVIADIRDILNYITEQYGVNFVVDSSVKAVPVTINVTDVPWNFALDSILKANRLGIEVTGNILRVATLDVLKDEAKIRAEEESARAQLREAQLQNAPLVTEIIRLNYARAGGTLALAAGSTSSFAGGNTPTSFSGGTGGDASGGSGETGILPIIARRLSKRGGIEVDGRSNTLIVTDVKENIDAIRRLVELLDQPEPQVEIETRVVVASRNFSRDLGVQLNAMAISSRGGLAGINTAPGAPTPPPSNILGPRPLGVPQNITNPTGALGAANPNTVIGLTTGIFGTAQISALITAAE